MDNQYSYNTASQITQNVDLGGAHNYGYDSVDRLTAATYPATTAESYGYDGVGNRTASHLSASYGYQPFNKLTSTATATYSFDNNGNLTSKTDSGGTTQYAWDFENRLKQVTLPNGNVITYKYDALGRRISRTASLAQPLPLTTTARFIYDGNDVIRDTDGNGVPTADYLNGPGIDNKLRQTGVGGTLYYTTDHLGSTRALTSAAGTVVANITYDSFGNSAGSALTRYTYTGREFDSDTGLLYYRARWYDPQLGRFISEDPIGLTAGDLNFYAYVENSPIRFTDPLGLQKRQDVDPPGTKYPTISVPQQSPKTSCCNKTWTECYAQCVENHRLDSLLPILGSALPKRILPPFRVVESSQRLTTVASTVAHYVPSASALRGAGRFVSRIGTPVLIFEGFYDWGILGSCAELCQRNPCN